MPVEWWSKVARMDRAELIDTLAMEADLRWEAQQKCDETLAELREAKTPNHYYLIGHLRRNADMAASRMHIEPKQWRFISTNDTEAWKLRGLMATPEKVFIYVPGWKQGRHYEQVLESLSIIGVDTDALTYAPSPEQDRMEGDSDWGRREMRTLEETKRALEDHLEVCAGMTNEGFIKRFNEKLDSRPPDPPWSEVW